MSDDITPSVDELTLLKERADKMGITYSPNIGIAALKAKIEAKTGTKEETKSVDEEAAKREQIRKEALKLIRCRIINMNPSKKAWRGEIITVANAYIGTVRKYVAFGAATNNGYHIPKCIYDFIKARKYQTFQEVKDAKGNTRIETSMVPEFAIEVLPQLTQKELDELATAQAAAGSIDQ
jgi:thiamine biosynthesis protein ThiC